MNQRDQLKFQTTKSIWQRFLVCQHACCHSSCSDYEQTVTTLNELVMQDEFDTNGAPNSAIWGYDIGTGSNGWGNNELQYYTSRPENVTVQNGNLVITARKESYQGSAYTSARLLTKGKFEQAYGRFEARIQLPWGQGIWPAFWMLGADINTNPWPGAGEIDIMEFRGQESNHNARYCSWPRIFRRSIHFKKL